MTCPKANECAGYSHNCYKCGVMADVVEHYPLFVDARTMEDHLAMVLAHGFDECLPQPHERPYTMVEFNKLVKYLVSHGVIVKG